MTDFVIIHPGDDGDLDTVYAFHCYAKDWPDAERKFEHQFPGVNYWIYEGSDEDAAFDAYFKEGATT